MIDKYLNDCILTLRKIIDITNQDIENIKKAKHDEVGPHSEQKTKLLSEFENIKKDLDAQLLELATNNPNQNLSDLLSQNSKDSLQKLRATLIELKSVNFEYAKNLVVVKEFFDSLLGKMLGKSINSLYAAKSKTPLNQESEEIFKARV